MITRAVFPVMLLLVAAVAVGSRGVSATASGVRLVNLTDWTLNPTILPQNFAPSFGPPPYPYRVPNTVVGNFVDLGAFAFDPLKDANFNLLSDPSFNASWIAETVFTTPTSFSFDVVVFLIDGINYKGRLSVNGVEVETKEELVGTFRRFEIDITAYLNASAAPNLGGATNTITVVMTPPQDHVFAWENNSTDLAITFVDWNPESPDHLMGLWRPVQLMYLNRTATANTTFPVKSGLSAFSILGASVTTRFNGSDVTSASFNVSFIARRWGGGSGTLGMEEFVTFYAHSNAFNGLVSLPFVFAPWQTELRVTFTDSQFPDQLQDLQNPALWWPWQMGPQILHTLRIGILPDPTNDLTAEELYVHSFGIREVERRLVAPFNQVQFFINKKPFQVRGGGWSPDIFLRNNISRLHEQYRLVRALGLNAIRLEGKMESKEFFDLADTLGIVILPGWCCCDAWQHWNAWTEVQMFIAGQSLRDQLRRLAIYPSVIVFLISSDLLPPQEVEQMYLDVAKDQQWPNPTISSAGLWTSNITGTTGVKMSGPYSWVPPVYWLADDGAETPYPYLGGAWGFLTEGGPGEAPMTYASWVDTVGTQNAWGINGSLSTIWDAHCGNPQGNFHSLRFFTPALLARYGGNLTTAQQYTYAAQAANYEGIRAFMEGYSRNKHLGATGFIQWMLNNAWPSHVWHLYDFYLTAGGGFYGAAKALRSQLHLMFSYTNGRVWLINSLYERVDADALNVTLYAQVYSMSGEVLWAANYTGVGVVPEDASQHVPDLDIPLALINSMVGANTTYLVRLAYTQGSSNTMLDVNDYWISSTMDTLDWDRSNWYRTPCATYADFSSLRQISSSVAVSVSTQYDVVGQQLLVTLSLPATAPYIAFFCRVDASRSVDGSLLRPAHWSDNYVSLVPGESRVLHLRSVDADLASQLQITVESWNQILGQ